MAYAAISRATSGELVAAVSGARIAVTSYLLTAASSVTVRFDSSATPLTGAMSAVVGVPLSAGHGGDSVKNKPHFVTAAGEALNVTLGSGVQVSGHLTYDLIRD